MGALNWGGVGREGGRAAWLDGPAAGDSATSGLDDTRRRLSPSV